MDENAVTSAVHCFEACAYRCAARCAPGDGLNVAQVGRRNQIAVVRVDDKDDLRDVRMAGKCLQRMCSYGAAHQRPPLFRGAATGAGAATSCDDDCCCLHVPPDLLASVYGFGRRLAIIRCAA